MRLAFVVGEVAAQRPTWGTVLLAHAAARRGHDVSFIGVDELSLQLDSGVMATCVRPSSSPASPRELGCALASGAVVTTDESLAQHDVVFLRHHPGRESTGRGNPMLDFGFRLGLAGVLVVNAPEGLHRAGGRMYLSGLPAEIRPRTLVTRDPARIKSFLKTLDAPAVLKPLAESRDERDVVFTVARGQVKNLNQIISVIRESGYVVVEEQLPEAALGEKRLLLLHGEPIRIGDRVAVYRRPAGPERVRKRCALAAADQRIVDVLRPKLVSDGLYLVAVDILGGKVLDVHVFTPGGLHTNQALYGIDVAEAVVVDLERRVAVRGAHRRTERVA